MRLEIFSFILFIAITLLGCGTSSQPKFSKDNSTTQFPSWVYHPNTQGVVGAVGSAKKQANAELQKRIALTKAKAALSESIKLSVESEILLTQKSSNHMYERDIQTSSKQTSSNLIKNAVIKDQFIDDEGTLYIWLVY